MGIKYRKGYKYQLAKTYEVETILRPINDVSTEFIDLNTDGWLIIRKGYAWDGPSGPTIDSLNFMRGSLIHDSIYQLIRMELISSDNRLIADNQLDIICKEDGMSSFRRWYIKRSLKRFGASAADPHNVKVVFEAP